MSTARSQFWWGLGFILCFAVPLIAHAYTGFSTRYLADDYCFASIARAQGLLHAQRHHYLHWRGVFSHSFVVTLAGLAGPWLVPYLPASVLGLWFPVTAWTAAQLTLMARMRRPVLTAFALAAVLVYATVYGTANVVQSLYWLSGMLSYTLPLIFLTLFAGVVVHARRCLPDRRPGFPRMFLAVALTFIAGGFSEVYVATQTGLLLLAVLITLRHASTAVKRTAMSLMYSALAGSVLAMVIVMLAPGNAVRQAFFVRPTYPLLAASLSPLYALMFLMGFALLSPITTVALILGSAVLGFALQPEDGQWSAQAASLIQDRKRAAQWIVLSLIAPVAFSYAPTLYTLFAGPPLRALVIPQFVVTGVVTFWSFAAGLSLRRRLTHRAQGQSRSRKFGLLLLLVLLMVIPLGSAWRTLTIAGELQSYAIRWDQRDRELRDAAARGEKRVVVQALGYTGRLEDFDLDPKHWLNLCVARYYGFDVVRVLQRSDAEFPVWFPAR